MNTPEPSRRARDYPDFVVYASALLAAHTALHMQFVALGWHLYELTRNPLDLGLLGLFEFLPAPILVLVTGHVADRVNRTRVMRLAYAAQAALSLSLLFMTAGAVDVQLIFLAVVGVGAARSFHGASARALVPNLVAAAALPNATAWRATILQMAMIMGPVVGGVLYDIGPAVVFGASTALQCLATFQIGRIHPMQEHPPSEPVSWQSLTVGFAFIRSTPALFGAISLDLCAVLFGGATALLPIYARDILMTGPDGLGWLRAAGGVGAMMMALCLVRWSPERAMGRTLFTVVAIFGAATVGFGLSTSFPLTLALLFVAGAADMVSMYIRSALVPLLTPDTMRGRVTAVEMVFIGASNELGAFESGLLATLLGPVPAVVIGGLATLVIAAVWRRLFPALYQVDRLSDLRAPNQ